MSYDNLPRLPDPTTVPAAIGFTKQTVRSVVPVLSHSLNVGSDISIQIAAGHWEIAVTYPNMTLAESYQLFPFFHSVNGRAGKFYIQLPDTANPKTGAWDTSTNALVAKGAITMVSANTIEIADWSTRGGSFSPGDMIKFDGSRKVYKVASTSLVGDTMTIVLNCNIIGSATQVATWGFEPNDVKIRVNLTDDVPTEELNNDGLVSGFTISMKENIL